MSFSRPIRFVYFDLDDTLLDHSYAEKAALEAMHDSADQPFGGHSFDAVHDAYRAINPGVWQKYAAGTYTKREAKVGRFSQLLERLDLATDADEALANRYLETYAHYWKPISGAFDAFEAIADHLPVGILTNGFVEVQQAKLRQFPSLSSASKAVVISEEVGVLKPDPRLFAEAARRAGMHPAHILYVGDSLTSDVHGGVGAGWQVAWYGGSYFDHPGVLSFSSWENLKDLVLNGS
jgi:5'-nucleotidase